MTKIYCDSFGFDIDEQYCNGCPHLKRQELSFDERDKCQFFGKLQVKQQVITQEFKFYDQLEGIVKRQGNSAHVPIPKSKLGFRVKVLFLDPEY